MKKTFLITICCALLSQGAVAQGAVGKIRQRTHTKLDKSRERQKESFNKMRERINRRYAEMLERVWGTTPEGHPLARPQEERRLKPIVFPIEEEKEQLKQDRARLEQQEQQMLRDQERLRREQQQLQDDVEQARKDKQQLREQLEQLRRDREQLEQQEQRVREQQEELRRQQQQNQKNRELPVVVTPLPEPKPQPTPTVPIEDEDQQPKPQDRRISITFYGTALQIRVPQQFGFSLSNAGSGKQVAQAWQYLATAGLEPTLSDCLELRRHKQLCDWAYLQLLQQLAATLCRQDSNEATLLTAFLYCQSGYKMRLGMQGSKLLMLYTSHHLIYSRSNWTVDGDIYYALSTATRGAIDIANASFPGEQPLSLQVYNTPQLAAGNTGTKTITSKRYPQCSFTVKTNRNLINFYNDYPVSQVGSDFGTRWATYATASLSQTAQQSLYPALRQQLAGKSEYEQVSRLLNLLQTGLVYEFDNKVWGHDRAFFPEESLYYDYEDCEDRAILLSRLVRDLLGLPVVLIYYPGHLAAAVGFSDNVQGDYLMAEGRRYVVCDPTYIGAPIGATMPGMDNATAKVIPVK